MESDVSCKCAARPNGLLTKTQLRCRALSTEHSRAIRYRTQGALSVPCVIYKRIAQVCTPTSTFLPYSSAQTIFCRNERRIERSKSAIPPPPINFPALQKPSHTLYCLWLASTPKGPHYLAHFHRTQWGEKGLWSFHALSAGCRCARGSISYRERSCLALNIYNHFASLPFWSNKVVKQSLIYSRSGGFLP